MHAVIGVENIYLTVESTQQSSAVHHVWLCPCDIKFSYNMRASNFGDFFFAFSWPWVVLLW